MLESISSMLDKRRTHPAPDINARIAARVRSLRAQRGLSLDSLAARCRVSKSMISLIERGEASPTASVLDRIATGLGVPLAGLFDVPLPSSGPVSRAPDRSTWRDPQSGYVRRNISPADFASPIQIVEVRMPPGARVAYENGVRSVSIHQQVWVQQGRIDVRVGRTTYQLAEDDCLAMRLYEPTAFRNPTRQTARYLVIIATERWGVARD
jgi:transcriptional regulator with XRE-family HTH domain